MTVEANKEIVERFDAMLETREFGGLDAVCTPDMVNHALRADRPKGLEGTRQWLETEGVKFQTFRWHELFVVAEDDLVVQFGVRGGKWPGGTFRGFDVPAGPYARDTAFMYRVNDGRISERWAVNDHLTWLLQLGAIPVPTQS
jgi:ketosteroid isomerase-like protein